MKKDTLLKLVKEQNRRVSAPLMGFPGAALTGTTIKENLCDAAKQLNSLIALAQEVKPDIIMPMMDLSVECEALGLKITFPDNESPSVEEHPIRSSLDLGNLMPFKMDGSGRLKVFLDTVSGLKKNTDAKVCAYVCGPFTLAGLLMGATEILITSYDDPESVKEITSYCTDFIREYSRALEASGADIICILDPTAVMLSPDTFMEFAGDYVAKVIADLNIPSILHICGNTTHLIDQMIETGVEGLSLDMDVDIQEVLERVPEDIVVIGNLDSKTVMPSAKVYNIIEETHRMLRRTAEYKNFVPSTGCDLPPETPIDNIAAFSATVRAFAC